jgi:GNAT superfamily N-acetyltransferase
MRLVDLALLPEFRGHGIGSRLLGQLQAEAARVGLPLRLAVLRGRGARGFYRRLGFGERSTDGVHVQLEWRAGG